MTTYTVPPRWLFLHVETDEGITGWGEPVLEGRAHTVAAAVDGARRLPGRQGSVADRGPSGPCCIAAASIAAAPIHMSALAGIDQALWDIKGKALGVPVHELLGGPVRDRIRVYSWIGGDRPADTAAHGAANAVARGFTAVKMNGTEEMQFIDYAREGRRGASRRVAADPRGDAARTSASASTSTAACTGRWRRC